MGGVFVAQARTVRAERSEGEFAACRTNTPPVAIAGTTVSSSTV